VTLHVSPLQNSQLLPYKITYFLLTFMGPRIVNVFF